MLKLLLYYINLYSLVLLFFKELAICHSFFRKIDLESPKVLLYLQPLNVLGRYSSGQRGQTVNLLVTPSQVRILLSPRINEYKIYCKVNFCGIFFIHFQRVALRMGKANPGFVKRDLTSTAKFTLAVFFFLFIFSA